MLPGGITLAGASNVVSQCVWSRTGNVPTVVARWYELSRQDLANLTYTHAHTRSDARPHRLHAYTHAHTRTPTRTHARTQELTHIHVRTHASMHTHTHTHKQHILGRKIPERHFIFAFHEFGF